MPTIETLKRRRVARLRVLPGFRAVMAALLLPLSCCGTTPCRGPSDAAAADRSAALAAVEELFAAMATRDVARAAAVTIPDGVFVVASTVDGVRRQRVAGLKPFLEQLGSGMSQLDERFTAPPTVLVDGDVAVVFGPYEFRIDGALSHTGIDVLTLVRTDLGWKLTGGVYSHLSSRPNQGAR
jgi:ketosteroid isomerase-like protein